MSSNGEAPVGNTVPHFTSIEEEETDQVQERPGLAGETIIGHLDPSADHRASACPFLSAQLTQDAIGQAGGGAAAVPGLAVPAGAGRNETTFSRTPSNRVAPNVTPRTSAVEASRARHSESFDAMRRMSDFSQTRVHRSGGMYKVSGQRRQLKCACASKVPEASKNFEMMCGTVLDAWRGAMGQGDLGKLAEAYVGAFERHCKEAEMPVPYSPSEMAGVGIAHLDMLGRCVGAYTGVPTREEMHRMASEVAVGQFQKGLRSTSVACIAAAATEVMREGLQSGWTPQLEEAWDEVVVRAVGGSLTSALEELGDTVTLVGDSWALAMTKMGMEDLGMIFYDILFDAAPSMRSMFTKNQKVMATKLVEMLAMIVSLSGKMDKMLEQMHFIGYRHVAYGARPAQVPVLGPILISMLNKVIGEAEWTDEFEQAWVAVWEIASKAMMEAIRLAELHGPSLNTAWERAAQMPKHKLEEAVDKRLRGVPVAGLRALMHGTSPCRESPGQKHKLPSVKSRSLAPGTSASAASVKAGTMPSSQSSGFVRSAASAGALVCEFVTLCVSHMLTPEALEELLVIGGINAFREGLKCEDLEVIGNAVSEALEAVLGDQVGCFGPEQQEAWKWYWGRIAGALEREIKVQEGNHAAVVQQMWKDAQAEMPDEDMADAFCLELHRRAPDFEYLFKAPRLTQLNHFKAAMRMLVDSADSPDVFLQQLSQIVTSHMRIGVRAEFVQPFGEVVKGVLVHCLEPSQKWNDAVEHSWDITWTRASTHFARAMNAANNKLTSAVVAGDLQMLETALETCPRGQRSHMLSAVQIKDNILRPLYWVIQDNKMSMARFIIEDILTIRADRNGYYYGADELFRDTPELLECLFDGLLWHSDAIVDGKVQTNFYIGHLYGSLDAENHNAFESPLSLLQMYAPVDIFYHPIVRQLIDVKWKSFGMKLFLFMQLWFAVILGWYLTLEMGFPDDCGLEAPVTRLGFAAMTLFTAVVIVSVCVSQVLRKMTMSVQVLGWSFDVPKILTTGWNLARVVSCLLLCVHLFLPCVHDCSTAEEDALLPERRATKKGTGLVAGTEAGSEIVVCITFARSLIGALASVLLWLQSMQTFVVSKTLASLTYTLGIMGRDVMSNILIIVLVTLSFASTLTSMREKPYEDATIWSWAIQLSRSALGVDTQAYIFEITPLAQFTVMVFHLIVNIGLLNVLIAQLSLTYQVLNDQKEGWALKHRASVVTEIEAYIPLSWRRQYHSRLQMDKPVPFLRGDLGPSGGISRCFPIAEVHQHPKFVPNRIIRFTGPADFMEPWPIIKQSTAAV